MDGAHEIYKDHLIMDRTYEALLNGRSYVFNSEQEAASFAKLWKCCYRLKDADHERYKCASIRMERHSVYYEQQHQLAQYQRLK